jgi:hypothetical protein
MFFGTKINGNAQRPSLWSVGFERNFNGLQYLLFLGLPNSVGEVLALPYSGAVGEVSRKAVDSFIAACSLGLFYAGAGIFLEKKLMNQRLECFLAQFPKPLLEGDYIAGSLSRQSASWAPIPRDWSQ